MIAVGKKEFMPAKTDASLYIMGNRQTPVHRVLIQELHPARPPFKKTRMLCRQRISLPKACNGLFCDSHVVVASRQKHQIKKRKQVTTIT